MLVEQITKVPILRVIAALALLAPLLCLPVHAEIPLTLEGEVQPLTSASPGTTHQLLSQPSGDLLAYLQDPLAKLAGLESLRSRVTGNVISTTNAVPLLSVTDCSPTRAAFPSLGSPSASWSGFSSEGHLYRSTGGTIISDLDGDGVPTTYEEANGLDPVTPDAQDDLDQDRFSNGDEYAAGTIANDGNSRLIVETIQSGTPGQLLLSWQSVPGKHYTVFQQPSAGGAMSPGGDVPSAGTQTTHPVPDSAGTIWHVRLKSP